MSEAAFVNMFTVVRVLLIGGILAVLPVINRKGLLFGAYVGEEFADGDAARALVRRWHLGCLALVVSSLVVGLGISLAGWPVAGNFTATAFVLLAGLGLYLRTYYAARKMAPPAAARQAGTAVASLSPDEPKGAGLAKVALCVCVLVSLATIVYAMVGYEAMPDRVPVLFSSSDDPDGLSDKSIVAFMLMPSMNLVISPFFALLALLTAGAKRSFRGGTGGRSAEAQDAFRAVNARLFSLMALFICLILTFYSVQMVRIGLSEIRSPGAGVWLIPSAMVVFMAGSLIWIMTKYGQGGALIEEGSAEAPLTNGLADNTHWFWGAFYVNKNDPSIMVEKRFGLGYTMNYGNRNAVLIVATFLVLLLSLTAVGLIGAFL